MFWKILKWGCALILVVIVVLAFSSKPTPQPVTDEPPAAKFNF